MTCEILFSLKNTKKKKKLSAVVVICALSAFCLWKKKYFSENVVVFLLQEKACKQNRPWTDCNLSSDERDHIQINNFLTFGMLGNFACFFVVCGFFFLINFFFKTKTFQEYHQSVKQFGSRSGPTFCKGYQQTTKVATSGKRVNSRWKHLLWVLLKRASPRNKKQSKYFVFAKEKTPQLELCVN